VLLWPVAALAKSASVDGAAITTTVIAENMGEPVFLTAPPGDPRMFVVDKAGRILILSGTAASDQPFLDISDLVSTGNEQGLLGLALHPDYANNGRFFVNYTDTDGD